MKKSLQLVLILMVIFLAGNVVVSAPVSVETAKTVAINFVKNVDTNASDAALSLVYSSDNFYVFSNESTWVIISADDRAYPVLGYSTESLFNIPVNEADTAVGNNFWGWMRSYEEQISYARENNLSASAEISQMWQDLKEDCLVPSDGTTAVEPLLTTTWGQGYPYNAMCPAGAVTGCVATAMGQILKYWNYPEQGLGSYGYTWQGYQYTYADFGATSYNWANMPNSTSEPNADIATLLYHTAVSCRSMWGSNTGVAVTSNDNPMVASFWNYFRMAFSSLRYVQKIDMPTTWEGTIQAELTAGRPVYYRGDGVGSHAWVCDGVDQNNLYHFNWGWDGMYNGYFALTAITPGSYNFTNNQAAIIGIQPNDGSTLVENTTWNGAITKTTSIAVPDAITLTVNPGTEIKFSQGAKLQICGQLTSIGEVDNYVNFTAIDSIAGWEGMDWDEDYLQRMADNDSSRLIYTQIQWSKSSGIYTYQFGKIVVDHCKVNDNTAENGGGICAWITSINISNSEFDNNHAYVRGGGICVFSDNSLATICYNDIHNNMSDIDGGGVYLSNVNYTIFENNIVHHNQAVKGAGAMLTSGSPMIVNNKFCNNSTLVSGKGGGLYLESCNARIINNLIANNTANSGGALGIWEASNPLIINNTISKNFTGTVSCIVLTINSVPNFRNTVIYQNFNGNGKQFYLGNDGCEPIIDHCDVEDGMEGFGGPGGGTNYNSANYTNNIDAEPLFVDPSAGAGSGYSGLEADWSLQNGSPCIDAGDTTGVSQYLPPFDLGGNPRINGTIDMGAYEYCVPAQPGEISGNPFPCESSTQSYSVISVPDISYFWELPTGWIINSGQGSNSVTVTAGSNSGQLSVTPSNACGDGQAQTLAVTVINLPAQANQPVGPDFVDLNYVNLSEYITQVVANADYYNWILQPASMGTISGNGNEITILWSGILGEAVLSVQAINACGESQISEPLIVQIDNSVGLEKPKFRNLNIYPNPSDGTFTITGISYFDKIELIGSLGTTIKTIENDGQNELSLDLSNLQPGIYQIRLSGEEGSVMKRIVKQ